MPATLTTDALLDRIEHGPATSVVPSARAAAHLRERFAARQQQAGRSVWTPPDVLSWTQWTASLWRSLLLAGHEDRILLNPVQEEMLWRDVIQGHMPGSLRPASSLAGVAAAGWARAAGYLATDRLRRSATTTDTRTFADWADSFRSRCDRERLVSAPELDSKLAQHAREGRLKLPGPLLLCVPSDPTPAQTALLDALQQAGCTMDFARLADHEEASSVRTRTVLPDEAAELRLAIRYIRDFLEQAPDSRAALVLPDVASERAGLEPLLFELLAPELQNISVDTSSAPWSVSPSEPLANAPAVRVLLDLLRWSERPLPIDDIAALLRSPHLCPAEQRAARARFAAGPLGRQLLLRPELDVRSTLRLARSADPELAGWLEAFAQASGKAHSAPPRRTFAEWTEVARELARVAGWPGTHDLTAAEFAVQEAVESLLDTVATLDVLGRTATFSETLHALGAQAAAVSQPRTEGARLEILSPGEASAGSVDLLVILRGTDANFPAGLQAHPLLDWRLQRDLRMPGTIAAVDEERSLGHFSALLATSPRVLLTSAAHSTDGALRPSAWGARFAFESVDPATLLRPESIHTSIVAEAIPDTAALPPLPSVEMSGGARLLKAQAACSFMAFAELRLGGREPGTREPGFDAIESGNVLHRALENFWTEVRTQHALEQLTADERTQKLTVAIDAAISRKLQIASPWDRAYVGVQKERMLRLLTRWLEFELQRGAFEVLCSEMQVPVQVGPLSLQVRIDRIDRLPEGGHVLVDYKTGRGAKPAAWNGDRPDEPQLPLYALLGEEGELRGVTFARIRAGEEMRWAGEQAEEGILPQKRPVVVDLDLRREEWREVLGELARQFHDGRVLVWPKNYQDNCGRCAQRLLCRVDATSLLAAEEPAVEDETG